MLFPRPPPSSDNQLFGKIWSERQARPLKQIFVLISTSTIAAHAAPPSTAAAVSAANAANAANAASPSAADAAIHSIIFRHFFPQQQKFEILIAIGKNFHDLKILFLTLGGKG